MSAGAPVDLAARLTRILDLVAQTRTAAPEAAAPAAAPVAPPPAPAPPSEIRQHLLRILALLEQRDTLAAERLAQAACVEFPDDAESARLHGVTLLMLGRAPAARAALGEAIRLAPEDKLAHGNYAAALIACGEIGAAVDDLQRFAREHPNDAGVRGDLANALHAAGNDARARDEYLAALKMAPDETSTILGLAKVELSLGMLDDAETRLRELLDTDPQPQGFLLLGHILQRQRAWADAQAAYLQGAQLDPGTAEFHYQAGLAADAQRHYAEAGRLYRRALQLDPGLHSAAGRLLLALRRQYDWSEADAIGARIRARIAAGADNLDRFDFLAEAATPAEQLACVRAIAARVAREQQGVKQRLAFEHAPRLPDATLKIAFVSAGFGSRAGVPHATAVLVAALFEELGKLDDIELHLIATTPDADSPIRQRLRDAAHTFHDADALSAADIARLIHASRIDILIDLDGWSSNGVPELFALKPAPLQVNWLAYSGSSGARSMDYLIADRFAIPEASQRFYTESIAWLPRCCQPADTTRLLFDSPPRASFGLPEDAVVFASFGNPWKLGAGSFARMCAVLEQVPDGVLWLLDAGREADARLHTAARAHGIDPRRLIFSPTLPHLQHLARHRLADLFLDTSPYNARTAASDAIWAGCPVLTRTGDTFASRIVGSLNHYLGMPGLIAADDAGFVATATRLGNDRAALAALHARLETQRDTSGLFDMEVYARDFATLLHEMDARRRQRLPPKAIGLQEPCRAIGA